MRRAINSFIKSLIKIAVRLGFTWPLVFIYTKVIKEVSPLVKCDKGNNKKNTILALNPDRFRDDLEILADEFRVLRMPFYWQCKILCLYWPENLFKKISISRYCVPSGERSLKKIQEGLRSFLRMFLKDLYKRLSIDCVIGAAVYYKQDYDWGLVSDEVGVPYIVIHREGLCAAKKTKEEVIDKVSAIKAFKGSHIIVQNQIMKDLLIQSNIVNSNRVSASGCLRMDDFVNRIRDFKKKSKKRKKVVLFSFLYGIGSFIIPSNFNSHDEGFVGLFEHVHVSIARLAMENKEVDFIIKPKWGGQWLQTIEYHLNNNNIDSKSIKNLQIITDINPHDLILEADVVCAFSSTTLLEAAITGIPVIVPYYDEALNPEYSDYVLLKDDFDIFDVAHNIEEFEELIIERLKKVDIPPGCMERRREVFEKYVSTLEGNAKEKYIELINRVIEG